MAKRVDPNKAEYLRLLLYGIPGSTKTRTASTSASDPRTSPVLMLEAGGNPVAIRDYAKKPDIIRVEELIDFNDPYDWIMKGQPAGHTLVKQFDLHPPYKCLIIDQLTEVQRMMFDKVMNMSRIGPGDLAPKRTWDHYNAALYSIINFCRLYDAIPMHLIMIAQEREGSVEADRPVGPLLEGQGQIEVPSHMEAVGRMLQISRVEPKLARVLPEDTMAVAIFKQSANYQAKDQYGVLGAYMTDPSIPKIMDLIFPHEGS
jgi:hypothetical protein